MIPEQLAVEDGTSVQVAALEEARPRRGAIRALDVSFLVPATSIASWDHTAAFVAFDDSDDRFRRLGAAVFDTVLFVELVDPDCAPSGNLFAGVPLPGI